jgi:hypothetical protein
VENVIYLYENTQKYYAVADDKEVAWWEVLMESTTATKEEVGWAVQPVQKLWRREPSILLGTEPQPLILFRM